MSTILPTDPVASALSDVRRLVKGLNAKRARQVRSQDQKDQLGAVALAWFQSYKPIILSARPLADLAQLDFGFRQLLEASQRSPSSGKMLLISKQLEHGLVVLQTEGIASPTRSPPTTETAPAFSAIPDPVMRQILVRRWKECVSCLTAEAPLAATVMMGGLLEALFLARVHRESNKRLVFTAASSPKDIKSKQPLPLKQWMLKDYIAVSHELGWIPQAVHDVSQILRDYRNYIHPQKEFSSQLSLTLGDAQILWAVCKAISVHIS